MIIVTGAAGFIGSNLVEAFEKKYPENPIVVCDWFGTEAKWRNLSKRRLYNIIPPESLYDFIEDHHEEIDAIFHLGASSSTTETDVDFIMDNNYATSMNLWMLSAIYGLRMIYASSAATYGDGEHGFDDHQELKHLDKLRPLNPYGWSKHAFDKSIMQRVDMNEPTPAQWVGLKFFNVYGPNEYHKEGQKSVVAGLYEKLAKGEEAKLFKSYKKEYADGGQLRDFVWVEDCVDVMLWFFENPEVSGIFNVGTGKARTFDDLAKAVYAALEREPKITYFDMPETLRDKYQYFTEANMKKLRDAGYDKKFTSLEDGIREYVVDYLVKEDDPYK